MIGDRDLAEVTGCEGRLPEVRSDGTEAGEPSGSAQSVEWERMNLAPQRHEAIAATMPAV
jgi:hypothetical protein